MSINALRLRPRLAAVLLLGGGGAAGGWTLRAKTHKQPQDAEYLHPERFSKFKLKDKQAISSTSSIFSLFPAASAGQGQTSVSVEPGRSIWSIQLKQPELQIARSYTPLPTRLCGAASSSDENTSSTAGHSVSEADDRGLQLLIRREAGGEVSGYLHKLPIGSSLEVRGPHVEYAIPSSVRRVLFLAGGTGIAPALQAAAALAEEPDARVHIIWANRKSEECVGLTDSSATSSKPKGWNLFGRSPASEPVDAQAADRPQRNQIVRALLDLQTRTKGRVSVQCFVDEEQRFVTPKHVAQALSNLQGGATENDGQVLLSGPDGFIGYWAGRKEWQNGKEGQGRLGGVLATLPLGGWTVWKL